MDRKIVYPAAIPLETDILGTNKNALISIGHVLQDMIGTSTLFSGLGCIPTSPAGMTVNVNPGRAYSYQQIDSGAYSSLPADAHQIVKQGILLDAVNFACPAPTTAGFSINYLIEGAFQEVDKDSVVLPYYNAANPAQAYSGPNGTGTSNTTTRSNTVQLQIKAGVAAATGSQITPTPDAGFNGLWVVNVPYGATTITSAMISQYTGAPFLSAALLAQIQAIPLHGITQFTSSGNWTCPAGVTTAFFSGCAAGSGGGGGGGGVSSGFGSGGGGGGAGQPLVRTPYTVVPGTVYAVAIGAGGAGGIAAGGGGAGGSGGAGGNTTVSVLGITLAGAAGGGGGSNGTSNVAGGAPGATGFPRGGYGCDSNSGSPAMGGTGASGPFGGGGGAGRGGQGGGIAAVAAYGYGAGGGGGGGVYTNTSGGVGGNGTAGMPGFIVIEW